MRIASSDLQMQAQHSATRLHAHSERLEMWLGRRPAPTPAADTADTANTGRTEARTLPRSIPSATTYQRPVADAAEPTASTRKTKSGNPYENLTPLLSMVRDLIERMTGVRAQNLHLPEGDAAAVPAPPASSPTQGGNDPGFGLVYERHEVLEESETMQWFAQGSIRTADGQEIRFNLQLEMQRYWREESRTELRLGNAVRQVDPLVINFDGTAAQLQDLRFAFDLDGDGSAEQVPLLAGNRGYLALDRNQNQRIDSGRELFGPATGNAYSELAAHDDDGNGWIDENDSVYQQLRIWMPEAQGPGRLMTLQEAGIGALALANSTTPFELRSNTNQSLGTVRATSVYLREDGSVGHTQQVDLSA